MSADVIPRVTIEEEPDSHMHDIRIECSACGEVACFRISGEYLVEHRCGTQMVSREWHEHLRRIHKVVPRRLTITEEYP